MSVSISIQGLEKSYQTKQKTVKALQKTNLNIQAGELYGLIGPDGAGKTTLFRLLTTLLLPDSGTATVEGLDIIRDYNEIRHIFGYMPGRFSLYQDLSVEENLDFFATIFQTSKEENFHLIRDIYVQLEPFRDRRAGKLSGGMKQKLALCCALIHRPKVLFLDEPTTGVDAVSRREFWAMLKNLQKHEITILVSTPYMDEANLCDKISLIQEGRIMASNSPRQIIERFPKSIYGVYTRDKYLTLHVLQDLAITDKIYPFGESLHWILKTDQAPSVPTQLQNIIQRIEKIEPDIEDVFIDYMRNGK
ncbi:MAG: ABC transporter ATP-binding protein [Saprospiraceae bacterium]|nr:ABC transporter ATP-binding protein [Saprospiraceae bacterium]